MTLYMLTYDLHAPGRDYSHLIAHLKAYPNWARPAESVWLLVSAFSSSQVRDDVRRFVDANDTIFVTAAKLDWASFNLRPDVVAWLQRQPAFL